MKSLFIRLSLGLLALLASGCASGPKFAEVAERIPPLADGHGRIFVYRASSMVGAAVQPDVRLNGAVVGESVPGGFFFVDSPAGDCVVSTSTEVERSVSFVLSPSETRYVRTVISMGIMVGRVYPELVDAEVGAEAVAKCHYIGSESALRSTAPTPSP